MSLSLSSLLSSSSSSSLSSMSSSSLLSSLPLLSISLLSRNYFDDDDNDNATIIFSLLKSMVGCCVVCSPSSATLPPSALLGARRVGAIADAFIAGRRALLLPISSRLSLHTHCQPLLAFTALINGWLLRPLSTPLSAAHFRHCPPCNPQLIWAHVPMSILRAQLFRR